MISPLSKLLLEIMVEFRDFKVMKKSDSLLMKAIDIILFFVTFGGMKKFMLSYTTTLGYSVYVCDSWDSISEISKMIILRHERVHMKQREKYGILFPFLYLVPFFPIFFANWRTKFEMEAYEESMRAEAELNGIDSILTENYKNSIISQFTGPNYGWMWFSKKRIEDWYSLTLESIKSSGNHTPGNYIA